MQDTTSTPQTPAFAARRQALRQLSLLPAAGLAAALPRFAHAAEFSLKYGNNLPVTHPPTERACARGRRPHRPRKQGAG